jgi:predicted nucleic acid-binding protein
VALTHLADTSVLTRLDRPPAREAVRLLLADQSIGCCRLSRLELGHSARTATEWERLMDATSIFTLLEVESADLRRAGEVQRLLAGAALRGRKVPDLVIAAVAERAGLTVLHYDRDFELISQVTGQRHQWVVPAGEID